MEDIKVGDYIRTKDGTITKIEDIEFEIKTNMFGQILYKVFIEGNRYYEVIVKHSPNIIDLIEVGDYVNGIIVTQSYIDNIKHIAPEIKENNYGIKSIVTKEMFSSVEYRVENN